MIETAHIWEAVKSMRSNRLKNYIIPGLHSSLIGAGQGKVRIFEAERDSRDVITPHSHRFAFTSLVLWGEVINTIYEPCVSDLASDAEPWIRSMVTQVCGPAGLLEFKHVRETSPTYYRTNPAIYKPGQTYMLRHSQIHSVQFSKGAQLLIFEMPQVQDWDWMLEPFVDGKLVPTFKTEPWMFQKE